MSPNPPPESAPATPIRILDIINLSTSAQTLLRNRVLAMRARGMDNRIMCMPGPYVQALRDAGIPTVAVDMPRAINPFWMVVAVLQMMTYIRREKIDLVHTHCSMPGILGRLAARLAGVPAIVHTIHGYHLHDRIAPVLASAYTRAEKFVGGFTDLMLSQNRTDMEVVRRGGFVPDDRLHLIGNGIDLRRFRPVARAREPNAPVTLLCVARLEPVKNHPMLFEAVRRAAASGRKLRLWLVGDGELRSDYEKRCAEMGLAGVVEFLGYRDDVERLLAQTDIAVLTSVKEGIPRAMLEAMAMKVPVVATRVVGTEETVADGETGYLVGLGDVEAMAERLTRLIDDRALRERMGERGRAWVEAHFDEDAIVDSLVGAYRQLVARGRAKGAIAWVPATRP